MYQHHPCTCTPLGRCDRCEELEQDHADETAGTDWDTGAPPPDYDRLDATTQDGDL